MGRGSGMVLVVLALALACAAPARAQRTGRILVSLAPGHLQAAATVATQAGAVAEGPTVPQIGLVTMRPSSRIGLDAAIRRLQRDPRVRAAAAEGRFELRRPFEPLDPAFGSPEPDERAPSGTTLQWYLERQRFPEAWSVTRGDGAVVAVIDTGIDATHPDLQGKVAGAVDLDEQSDEDPLTDGDGHGTHVSSLACAGSDNGIGITGAGFNCRLLVLRSDLTDASVAGAIVEAADRGAHALNMSFGDDGAERSPAIADAVTYAVARGVVLVAAAADEAIEEQGEPANLLQPTGTGGDPAAGRGLSVTAATIDDERARFAGRGSQISVASYGALRGDRSVRGLFSLYPGGATPREQPALHPAGAGCGCRASFDGDSRYAFMAGTSMAAPQVAAAAALVRHVNPDLGVLEVVRIIKQTARRRDHGWNADLGWGILDAGAAVEAARRVDRRPPTSRARIRRRARGSVLLGWSGRDVSAPRLPPAGIGRYEIWRAVDGGGARRVAVTRRPRRRFAVSPGRRYAFFTIAVDAAGNREGAPPAPDVVVVGH